MRLNRHQVGASAIRLLSVTAAAATACALWAGTASAATTSVARHATTTSISISPKTADVGVKVKLSATVKSSGGTRARGIVTFKWHGVKLCSGRLVLGATHCRAAFSRSGTYAIRAYYGGNATHKASFSTRARVHIVNPSKHATTTTITSPDPTAIAVGKSFTVQVSVTSAVGTPSGTVVVKPTAAAPGTTTCTATLTAGKGSCKLTPAEYGVIDYTATYSGDATHDGSTYAGPWALEVQNVTTTTAGPATAAAGAVTLTVDVYAMGADITDGMGSVAFYDGTTVISGCAAVPLKTFDTGTGENEGTCPTTLAKGTYTINVKFSGDDVNEPSNGSVTITVS